MSDFTQPGIIRDDFAGPGGWSQACKALGLIEHGVEFDEAAVRTAQAAGHLRWLADVTSDAVRTWEGWQGMWGYIASPPCQTFSAAGKGAGRAHLDNLVLAMKWVAEGMTPQEAVQQVCDDELDERSVLVLEPLLVIRDHRPTWVALEQVPQVLPIWEAYAQILKDWGYHVWTGLLQAEQYGVPQTRKRAILMAHSEREVAPPKPTHSKYYSHDRSRLDEGVLPWVSMSQALNNVPSEVRGMLSAGGNNTAGQLERTPEEPSATITGKGTAYWQMRSNYGTGGDPAARGERSLDEPAPTVTSKIDRNKWVPTAANEGTTEQDMAWTSQRPSPTVVGSFRPEVVAAPGYRKPGDGPRQKAKGSVRVTLQEAGVLQSFPVDYPWWGTSSKQFQQVGNAIPPLLAQAILQELVEYRQNGKEA